MSHKVRRRSPVLADPEAAAHPIGHQMPVSDCITQNHIIYTVIPAILRFYDDPENMAAFQEWLKARDGGMPCLQ